MVIIIFACPTQLRVFPIRASPLKVSAEQDSRSALETGIEVACLDVCLAPEHPYLSQLEDALKAFDALLASAVAAQHLTTSLFVLSRLVSLSYRVTTP